MNARGWLGAALLWWAAPALAQELSPAEAGLKPELLERIGPAVRAQTDRGRIAGAVVGIVRRGRLGYLEAFGKADVEAAAPMRTDTIFRIYSMTKPITSAALMMLVEEGRCGLDDPVSQHLPEFKGVKVYAGGRAPDWKLADPERPMTVRDLLRHTSGLTYGFLGLTPVDAAYNEAQILGPDQDLAAKMGALAKIPLLAQPGTRFIYSVSVDVQGRLIEVLSGKTLDVFFRERIFEPLGMADTGFWVPPEKLERLACNYGADLSGALKVSDRPATSLFRARQKFLSGGGGLVSTARDYLRFCRMILNGGELDGRRLLKAETVAQMTRNQLPEKAVPISVGVLKMEGVGFGLGFSVRLTDQKDRPAGECGWGGAASTHFWISPKHELAVVALEQFMPFTARLDELVRPHVYAALAD